MFIGIALLTDALGSSWVLSNATCLVYFCTNGLRWTIFTSRISSCTLAFDVVWNCVWSALSRCEKLKIECLLRMLCSNYLGLYRTRPLAWFSITSWAVDFLEINDEFLLARELLCIVVFYPSDLFLRLNLPRGDVTKNVSRILGTTFAICSLESRDFWLNVCGLQFLRRSFDASSISNRRPKVSVRSLIRYNSISWILCTFRLAC